jgi:hypothetical protein
MRKRGDFLSKTDDGEIEAFTEFLRLLDESHGPSTSRQAPTAYTSAINRAIMLKAKIKSYQ